MYIYKYLNMCNNDNNNNNNNINNNDNSDVDDNNKLKTLFHRTRQSQL